MSNRNRQRLHEIDQLTGFTIILVVIGHLVATKSPTGNQWYDVLQYTIYKFHMPLFMFLSGIVFSHTLYTQYNLQNYQHWVVKKTLRLAPGFIGFGLFIIAAKTLAIHFFHVDNPPRGFIPAITRLFLIPTQSPSASLWYIYVLLEFYLIFPLLMPIIKKSPWPILIVTASLHYLSTQHAVPQKLMAKSFCEYSWYFYLGILAKDHYLTFCQHTRRFRYVTSAIFVLSFLTTLFFPEKLSKSWISLWSIPACFYWSGLLRGPWTPFLTWVGSYCFTIYLLNTLLIGSSKALLLKIMPWDGINFLLFFVVLLLCGLFGAIYCHKWILSRIPFVDRATR